MKEVLTMLKLGIKDDGCYTSDEFKIFARVFKKNFKKEIEKIGGTKLEQSTGHYYLSGFFTVNEQPYYYSISDVRHSKINNVLVRTAKDYKDYTGGSNHYITIKENMFENEVLDRWH